MAPKNKKGGSKVASRVASGTATPTTPIEKPVPVGPAMLGVNFGQTFSSIAIINKEGLADCIANDDGERQIASAISFNGSEEYFGIPARNQLVRNAQNTILNFRNLLGKTYDEVKSVKQPYNSAQIINHDGQPAFTVQYNDKDFTLTAHQVAVRYLKVLLQYAQDFVGRPVTHAVVTAPSDFSPKQIEALEAAAKEAGIKVQQSIPEAAAALTAYHSTLLSDQEKAPALDRNTVVLDVGATSTTATVVAVRDGLFAPLATVSEQIGGDLFDEKLMDWFSKEFTKKTKTTVEPSNHRAQMKLRHAVEATKRSLSASTSAPCSIESLAEGLDFHGTVNRTRFDLLVSAVYSKIVSVVEKAVKQANLDPAQIQEVIFVGGSSKLPALANKLLNLLPEETIMTSSIEPDEVVAKGCALEALALTKIYPESSDSTHSRAITEQSVVSPSTLSKPLGFVVDAPKGSKQTVDGKLFVTLVEATTPLPLRRITEFSLPPGAAGPSKVKIALWEGAYDVKEESIAPAPRVKTDSDDEDDDDEDDEPEIVRTALVKPEREIVDAAVEVDLKDVKNKLRVTVIVEADGKGKLVAQQGSLQETRVEF